MERWGQGGVDEVVEEIEVCERGEAAGWSDMGQ